MVHLVVAFASPAHASEAMRFLSRSPLSLTLTPRPVRRDADMALVDIDVPAGERDRLGVLIAGVHGLVVDGVPALAVPG